MPPISDSGLTCLTGTPKSKFSIVALTDASGAFISGFSDAARKKANTSQLNNSLVLATSDFFPDHLSLPIASHHFFPVTTHRHQNR
jgi:hypothetical protein